MSFDPNRIPDPLYFAQHRLPAHSDHRWFASRGEAEAGISSFEQCLNGVWKFHYAKNLAAVPVGFQAIDYDCGSWDDIRVPAHIQLEGYDRPQYVNVQYPWDGREQIAPGQVPQDYNPVASYVTTFQLGAPLAPGERLSVSFKGAESAIAVWLNGHYIGYACDTFTPSEFDLTEHIQPGQNKLAAQVFKWSGASWIEDQDFYRFSGIFRDVVLYRRPAAHAEDLRVTAALSEDLRRAEVTVQVSLEGAGTAAVRIEGIGELAATPEGTFTASIADPRLWSAEDPHLYTAVVEVRDESGALVEYVSQSFGVRRFGIEDGVLKINGQRIVFKGVNRHEFGLQGRVMTRERTEADIRLIKANGLNAIRTSHYPNNSFFYELCDEYGLYVIDEMNLESHGMWDRIRYGGEDNPVAVPGDKPEWLPALLDRAASMVQRDKNHPSIVMWSCGNESFGGTNILAVSNYFREVDDRPVHYEGVHWDPRYPETTDVTSQMYTPAADIEAQLKADRTRPFILCEFAHAMGNSFGAVDKYLDLAYRDPQFQGGFIWDFADQAIQLRDRYGKEYFGYGGDCGEAPHDGEFCGNGILFADHTPTPRMQEVKYLYQAFKTAIGADSFTVENRHLFTSTAAYECVVSLRREGGLLAQSVVETDVAPGQSAEYPLPFSVPADPGEYAVEVSYRLREATRWAAAGHEMGWEQRVFAVEGLAPEPGAPAPEVVFGIHNVGVRGEHFSVLFSRLHGGMQSYRYGSSPDGGRELLRGVPKPNFWHAPTSNERGWNAPSVDGQWLLASRYATTEPGPASPSVEVLGDSVSVSYTYLLPTRPQSECAVTYRVFGTGRIEVTLTARLGEGLADMPEFGMMLCADADLHNLRWYGEGPEECYVDRRGGARLGIYEADVVDMLTPYLRPQEAGSRTGVRWATVTDDRGHGLRFDSADSEGGGMEFSALPWTPYEVENALHHTELPPLHRTVLRPALMRRGVGGDDSWGAKTHPEYLLPVGRELVFRFGFQGVL